jgi:hypothetical protein
MTNLSLKNDVNVPLKSNKHKNRERKIFFVGDEKVTEEKARSGTGVGSAS